VLTAHEQAGDGAGAAFGRRSDRRRNAEESMEAIVSSEHPQRMKGAAPAVQGPLLDHACSGRAARVTPLLGNR